MDFRLESGRLRSAAAVRVPVRAYAPYRISCSTGSQSHRDACLRRFLAVYIFGVWGASSAWPRPRARPPFPLVRPAHFLLYGLACASRKRCSRPLCWLSPCQKSFRRISAARHVAGSDLPLSRGANSAIEPVTGSAAVPQRTAVIANGRIGTAPPSTARHKTAAALATGNRSSQELTPREEKL